MASRYSQKPTTAANVPPLKLSTSLEAADVGSSSGSRQDKAAGTGPQQTGATLGISTLVPTAQLPANAAGEADQLLQLAAVPCLASAPGSKDLVSRARWRCCVWVCLFKSKMRVMMG